MSNLLYYKYRAVLDEKQKGLFDSLSECSAVVYNLTLRCLSDMYGKNAIKEMKNVVDWKKLIQRDQSYQYIERNFPAMIPFLMKQLLKLEAQIKKGKSNIKKKKLDNPISSISFYAKDADLKMLKREGTKAEISMLFFGTMLMYYHRPFPKNSRCVRVTLKRESNMFYYLEFLLDNAYKRIEPKSGESIMMSDIIGLDFSMKKFFVSTDNNIIPDLKEITISRKEQKLIHIRHKNFEQSEEKSKNKERKRLLYVNLWRRIRASKIQYFYILAHDIFDKYEAAAVENLAFQEMKEKTNYAKIITKESYSTFVKILTEVARKEGKRVIVVPKWFPSSKICSYCGKKNENLKIYDKEWYCPHCGRKLDRDKNAAENIRHKAYEMIRKEA